MNAHNITCPIRAKAERDRIAPQVGQLFWDGSNYSQIAREFGVSTWVVIRIIKENGFTKPESPATQEAATSPEKMTITSVTTEGITQPRHMKISLPKVPFDLARDSHPETAPRPTPMVRSKRPIWELFIAELSAAHREAVS